MTDLSYPWGYYERLQTKLRSNYRVSCRTVALEEVLNRILSCDHTASLLNQQNIDRDLATHERREGHRTKLRVQYLQADNEIDIIHAVEAYQELTLLKNCVISPDWNLLCEVAEGYEYAEIAVRFGVESGTLRTRVARLRRRLARAVV